MVSRATIAGFRTCGCSSEAIRPDNFSENSRTSSSSIESHAALAVRRRLYSRLGLLNSYGLGSLICELCGAEVPRTKNVAIESTVLSVCASCAKFGDEVMTPAVRSPCAAPVIAQRLEARSRRLTPRDVYAQGGEEELAGGYFGSLATSD